MNRKIILAGVTVLVVGAGIVAFAMSHKTSEPSATPSPVASATPSPSSQAGEPTVAAGPEVAASSFTINADDSSADQMSLSAKKGSKVTITFNVKSSGVYHGGLEFKGNGITSGNIEPGKSGTVTFTADKSFDFVPYWYASQVKKDYVIAIKVQ